MRREAAMLNPPGLALAQLPLLLWRTPPGLQLVLAQEGVAHEIVSDAHPLAFRGGRFVLYDGRQGMARALHRLLTGEHVAIDIDDFRRGEPYDPFAALVSHQSAQAVWEVRKWRVSERVARYPKAWIRRRLISRIRDRVLACRGVWLRLASFPYPYRSAFHFRVDLDEQAPEDYHPFALTRSLLEDCCTHFVCTHAYENEPEVLRDLHRYDTQSHGHFHHVYRDARANLSNLERADRVLRDAGFAPRGFAAPHGRWSPGLDDGLEALGYEYSSDFQLDYDNLPFFPWKAGRFSKVLQIPVHPVCEGLFLEAGLRDGTSVADYLRRVVEAKFREGEPAFIYGHPEGRLAKMPEILIAIQRLLLKQSLVWRVTMSEMARWWRWRARRRFMVLQRESASVEIQCDEWDMEYPLAMEIHRGSFRCSVPLRSPLTLINLDELAYERMDSSENPRLAAPLLDLRRPGLKAAIREALDWETVTPLEDLSTATLQEALKKGLRWWKLQKTGTG
jgi:hypothetical protein